MKGEETCKWVYSQCFSYSCFSYETQCKKDKKEWPPIFSSNYDIEDGEYKFCPYCGKEIEEIKE